MEQTLFYILAAVTVAATLFAITERHTVHAIVYLVTSFFALAVIFFLLGAPVVAAFEVIIYAGAIMVLFLFVIMMLDLGHPEKVRTPGILEWVPAAILGTVTLGSLVALVAGRSSLPGTGTGYITIRDFSVTLFRNYGIAVEIISLQLLFALVGALYLGRRNGSRSENRSPGTGRTGEGTE
ncbi:NADH-quinone oxidoreductase subunit J [Geobacter sp. DSM 9736]|uniref:NADH-quinone oxidoreductase subunit J family protein n=1 Tax=Geobacter sp. DSM 9736 TaxID=1277350 RepID=UPI000B5114DA|nr:NADH-quinone oxidoreductase subunit J [Geobacter sp. DSM 9736]SNB46943.1 NADH dehydrogenase subunit J [Geobacter sp. DSM 9736]